MQKSTDEFNDSVAKEMKISQKQHAELVTLAATVGVTELLKLAMSRLNKLHAPKRQHVFPEIHEVRRLYP